MVNPNLQLIYPMFAMVMLTFGVGLVVLKNRIAAVKGGMPIKHFKTYTEGQAPESMVKADRHFVNLFEVPLLFYVGCLVAMMMPLQGIMVQVWAWLFVAMRILHAYIHIGPNKLRARMTCFWMGCAAVVALWIQIVISI